MDHKQAASAIAAWARAGQGEPLPAWDDLPAIPLYMDQVILYLSESLRLFQPEGEPSLLTSSMINNYVKNGLIPHPEKKKYRKEHLAGLIVLCLLKQVLPIPDVKALFSGRAMDAAAYQLFRQAHNAALQETCRALETLLRLGYRRFEVFLNAMEELSPPFLRGLGERARAYGASFVSVHPFTSAAESTLLFGDYPRRTREGFDFYRRYLAAAAQLGARWVVIHGQPQGHGALSDEGYWRRFGELYQLGKEEGAFPAQENVRQHRSARPEFIAGMARYLGEDCAFVLDVKQCRMAGARVEDMVGAMGPRLVHVHLSDAAPGRPCLLPGAGEEDLPGLLALLGRAGFAGTLVTEVYRRSFGGEEELAASLEFTKNAVEGAFS